MYRWARRSIASAPGRDGLSAKVLNERLRKLVRYGILDKTSYAELPSVNAEGNAVQETERKVVGVMVKQAKQYRNTGGWGFEALVEHTCAAQPCRAARTGGGAACISDAMPGLRAARHPANTAHSRVVRGR